MVTEGHMVAEGPHHAHSHPWWRKTGGSACIHRFFLIFRHYRASYSQMPFFEVSGSGY